MAKGAAYAYRAYDTQSGNEFFFDYNPGISDLQALEPDSEMEQWEITRIKINTKKRGK